MHGPTNPLGQPTHTDAFAAFQARRNEQRAAQIKVTWRKVDPLTGGGWSGLGPDGALVFVVARDALGGRVYDYGDVLTDTRPWRRSKVGTASTLARAKREAEALFTHEAATAAEGGPLMESSTATLTAESVANDLDGIEVVRAGKAPYSRFQAGGKTLAYADDRKDGFVLSISGKALEPIAAGKKKAVEINGNGRGTMRVTSKNAKAAATLLTALAKNVG